MDSNNLDDEECPICLETLNCFGKYLQTPCNHGFHTHCLTEWFERKGSLCPFCQTPVKESETTYWPVTEDEEPEKKELTPNHGSKTADEKECSICKEFLNGQHEDGVDVLCLSTQCGHKFHTHCLLEWMEKNDQCSDCQLPIDEKFIFYCYAPKIEQIVPAEVASAPNLWADEDNQGQEDGAHQPGRRRENQKKIFPMPNIEARIKSAEKKVKEAERKVARAERKVERKIYRAEKKAEKSLLRTEKKVEKAIEKAQKVVERATKVVQRVNQSQPIIIGSIAELRKIKLPGGRDAQQEGLAMQHHESTFFVSNSNGYSVRKEKVTISKPQKYLKISDICID